MIPSLSDFVETGYQLPPSDCDVGLLRTGTIVTLPCQSTVGQTAPAASVGARRFGGAMPLHLRGTMTAEAVGERTGPRKQPRRIKPRPQLNPDSVSIGETDPNIFNCPVSPRPLATGAHRCPTWGTRLLLPP